VPQGIDLVAFIFSMGQYIATETGSTPKRIVYFALPPPVTSDPRCSSQSWACAFTFAARLQQFTHYSCSPIAPREMLEKNMHQKDIVACVFIHVVALGPQTSMAIS
jgi:hypothetical protein